MRRERTDGVGNLSLRRLSLDNVERYVSLIPQLAGMSPAFAVKAHALTDGNPFFLGEVVIDAVARGVGEAALPTSLQAAMGERLGRVSEASRTLAAIAAIIGRAFDVETVSGVSGLPEAEVIAGLDELLDLRLVKEASGVAGPVRYDFSFAHDLLWTHVYSSVSPEARARRHRRVALVMETLYRNSLEAIFSDLAHHFDQGMEPERAAFYYHASARKALNVYAHDEALTALSRGLELTTDDALRFELLLSREAIYSRQGVRSQQLADLNALETLGLRSGDENNFSAVLERRIGYARVTGDVEAQQRHIDALESRARHLQNVFWKATAFQSAAQLDIALGKYQQARRHADGALSAFGELKDSAGTIRSLCLITEICALQAQLAEAGRTIEKALVLARSSSSDALVIPPLIAASLAAYLADDYGQAAQLAQQCLRVCLTVGDREGEADCLFRLGNIDSRCFDIDGAVDKYTRAAAIYQVLDKRLGEAMVVVNMGLLFLKFGDYKSALANFSSARPIFAALKDLHGLTVCAINVGMLAYLQGRYSAAWRLANKALALADALGRPHLRSIALSNLGSAERELGDLTHAIAHCEEGLKVRRAIAPTDIASDLADMGLTYVRAHNISAALAIANEISALDVASLNRVVYPQNVLWIAAQIYAAAGFEDLHRHTVRRACQFRDERLSAIPDGPWRVTYDALPFNREIGAAMGILLI